MTDVFSPRCNKNSIAPLILLGCSLYQRSQLLISVPLYVLCPLYALVFEQLQIAIFIFCDAMPSDLLLLLS